MKSVKNYIILTVFTVLCSGIATINAMNISEIPIQVQPETREALQQAISEVRTAVNELTVNTRTTLGELGAAINKVPRELSRSLLSLSIGITGLTLIAGTLWNMMHQDDSHPQNRRAQTAALALGFTGLTYSIWSLRR